MASDEASRARLRARIEAEMGTETADLLSVELAGIHGELQEMRSRLDGVDHRFDLVDAQFEILGNKVSTELHREIAGVRQDMLANTRLLFFSAMGSTFTAAALAFAAVRFG